MKRWAAYSGGAHLVWELQLVVLLPPAGLLSNRGPDVLLIGTIARLHVDFSSVVLLQAGLLASITPNFPCFGFARGGAQTWRF